jgi:hypothetical protein
VDDSFCMEEAGREFSRDQQRHYGETPVCPGFYLKAGFEKNLFQAGNEYRR